MGLDRMVLQATCIDLKLGSLAIRCVEHNEAS